MTIINLPVDETPINLADDGLVWKQVIPMDKEIVYGGKKLKFTKDVLNSLKKSYDAGVLQQTAFQLADDQNRHDTEEDIAKQRNFDPDRFRGDVSAVTVDSRGFRCGFKLTEEGKKAIKSNPKLGVSAGIKPNYVDENGTVHDLVLRHVVGTLDPKIKHMSDWELEGISLTDDPDEEVFDLTSPNKVDDKDVKANEDGTISVKKDDYEKMVADLKEFNEGGTALLDQILAEVAEEEKVSLSADGDSKPEPVQDPAIAELKNKFAASEWKAERLELSHAGVPAAMLNLCDDVMSVSESPMINLSNGDEADPRDTIRKLLNEARGTVDLTDEAGHGYTPNADEQEDERAKAYINQYMNPLF